MWFLLSSDTEADLATAKLATAENYQVRHRYHFTKFIVRQDNLTEFLSKNGGDWTVERVQEWTPKVHLDNEKQIDERKSPEPLSR